MPWLKTRFPVDLADAEAIYAKLTELRELFSELDFRAYPSLVPERTLKEARFDGTEESCQRLADSIQSVMGIEGEIRTFFLNRDDAEGAVREKAKAVPTEGHWEARGVAGVYYHPASDTSGTGAAQVAIDLQRFAGSPPESLVATLAHEYAHHKLLHEKSLERNDEIATDLLPILYGYGIFIANAAFRYKTEGGIQGWLAWHSWSSESSGYLPVGLAAFAHAIVSSWKEERPSRAGTGLSVTAGDFYMKSRRFLESHRQAPWSGKPDSLMAWLAEGRLRAERSSGTEDAPSVEARMKWRGTFHCEPEPIAEGSCIADPMGVFDFGDNRREVYLGDDRAFGLTYSIVQPDADDEIEIEEVAYPLDAATEDGSKPLGLRRLVKPGELTYFACLAGLPPCDRPGRWTMELRHGERTLRKETFELRNPQSPERG